MTCARPGCEKEFESKKHNQRFCSQECQKISTNARIMEAYHDEKARKSGEARYCKVCKENLLSRYNTEGICSQCNAKSEADIRRNILGML